MAFSAFSRAIFLISYGSFVSFGSPFANTTQLANKMPVFLNATMEKYVSTKPSSASNQKTLTILATVNYGGATFATGPVCTKAMEFALERLRNLPDWLPNYDLSIKLFDDECEDNKAIRNFAEGMSSADEMENRLPVMLVHDCINIGQLVISEIMAFNHYIGFTNYRNYLGEQTAMQRQAFQSLFPLMEELVTLFGATLEFAQKMGWHKIAIFSEDYHYFNEVDKLLFKLFDERNITLVWIGKVKYLSTDSQEMEETVLDMKKRDPRIIIANSNSPVSVSCWFHRLGLFGPNYAIIASAWSTYNPDQAQIPDYVSSWCTPKMLREIASNWIYFIHGSLGDIFGDGYRDSTGTTRQEVLSALQKKIVHPEQSPAWGVWPWTCYDLTIMSGFVLNATEGLLRTKYNSTLIEWTTDSANYKQNNEFISKVMKEAMFTIEIFGSRGDYRFSSKTLTNSLGYTPIIFSQMRQKPGSSVFVPTNVAYYKSNEKRTTDMNGGPYWGTPGNTPPQDSASVVKLEEPPNSIVAYGVLTAISALAIVLILVLIGAMVCSGKLPENLQLRIPIARLEDFCILFGNIVMLSHVFAIPAASFENVMFNSCSAYAVLLVVGYTLTGSGMVAKLINGSRALNLNAEYEKAWRYLGALWLIVHLVLICVFVGLGGLEVLEVALPSYYSKDLNIIYEPFRKECNVDMELDQNVGLVVAMGCLHALSMLISVFKSYEARTDMKNNSNSNPRLLKNLGRACNCVYCQTLVVLAGIVIALAQISDISIVGIVIAALTIAYTHLDLALIYLAEVIRTANRQMNTIDMANRNRANIVRSSRGTRGM